MQGFSVPRSPQGRTSLTPPPPWYYAGNLLLVDYAADPQAVAAVLPPGLTPDPRDPGGCTAFFVDWQYASTSGEELTDHGAGVDPGLAQEARPGAHHPTIPAALTGSAAGRPRRPLRSQPVEQRPTPGPDCPA
jgi:hypothetical protein